MNLSKNRDLNNKLRANLLKVPMSNFTLKDFYNLFNVLAEGKENRLDSKLFINNLFKKNAKVLLHFGTVEEFKETVDMIEFILETNPLIV